MAIKRRWVVNIKEDENLKEVDKKWIILYYK